MTEFLVENQKLIVNFKLTIESNHLKRPAGELEVLFIGNRDYRITFHISLPIDCISINIIDEIFNCNLIYKFGFVEVVGKSFAIFET